MGRSAMHHNRLVSIDVLRGVVMILMALDHTRDFFSNATIDPTDIERTWPALFLTRWITHFCAPVFIFLAGAGAYLSRLKVENNRQQAAILLKRGVWIIFLGVGAETLIWSFTPDFTEISGAVLWAIGWSMICLAALIFLPLGGIAAVGLVMIAAHNGFDPVQSRELGVLGPLWSVLHTGETVRLTANLSLRPFYPLIPWIGVMALGYAFGPFLLMDRARQRRVLTPLGLSLTIAFVVLRGTNLYGDPEPWAAQENFTYTVLSFLNCEKYPPSLLYLLMTLGPAIAILPWLDRKPGWANLHLLQFGRVPLFFYLLHLPVIAVAALIQIGLRGGFDALSRGDLWSSGAITAYGFDLLVVYLIWFILIIALYPACRWYGEIKSSGRHPRWLRFL